MIKVLNALFDERLGGPQQRVLEVARGLRERGVETIVVIPCGDGTFASLLSESGIPFKEFGLVRLRATFNPLVHARYLARFWQNVAALRRLIREQRVSAVHTNGLCHLQAAVAARLERVPLVWHLNDTYSPWLIRKVFPPLVRAWASRIAIAAQAVGQYYSLDRKRLDGCLHVLYAPVDVKRFFPVDSSEVRAELGVSSDTAVVGTVANICPGKGLEYLLEAAPQIRQRHSGTKFVVVGRRLKNRRAYWSALLRRRAELGLEKDVIFTGGRSDVPQIMRALTVYVHPSESEACPMAVLEASASALPVVAMAVGGVPEIVDDGVTGFLAAPGSPGQLADAVIRILSDPALARQMGEAGRERMCRMFSLEKCVGAHVELYRAALKWRDESERQTAQSDEELKVKV